jgi:hypothetical protein
VSPDIGNHLTKLDTLVLINNHIATLSELDNIASFKALRELALLHNPVTKRENYRWGGGLCMWGVGRDPGAGQGGGKARSLVPRLRLAHLIVACSPPPRPPPTR